MFLFFMKYLIEIPLKVRLCVVAMLMRLTATTSHTNILPPKMSNWCFSYNQILNAISSWLHHSLSRNNKTILINNLYFWPKEAALFWLFKTITWFGSGNTFFDQRKKWKWHAAIMLKIEVSKMLTIFWLNIKLLWNLHNNMLNCCRFV